MLFGIKPASILHAKWAVVWLRVFASLAWLNSAFIGPDAKLAPAFLHGGALAARIGHTFVHTAIDFRVAHLLTAYVAPHAAFFAALIAAADVAIGLSLALGLFVRLGAVIAIVRALINIIVAGGAGADTVGYNLMLIVTACICIATAAGRKFGFDRQIVNRYPRSDALRLIA